MGKFVTNFREWAISWFYKAKKDKYVEIINNNSSIIVAVDKRNGKCGVARCKKGEVFNNAIGIGVAYAKLCGEQIPKEMARRLIKDLTNGQSFRLEKELNNITQYYAVGPISYTYKYCYSDNLGHLYTIDKDTCVYIEI